MSPWPANYGTGLTGEYFNRTDLRGPVTAVRTDAEVNFDWGMNSPLPGMRGSQYSVRWSGQVQAPVNGNITLAVQAAYGVRLYLAGTLVFDKFAVQTTGKYTVTIPMQAGFKYRLVLESWQGTGGAGVKLLWTYPGTVEHPIPARYLFGDAVTWLSDLPTVSATNGDGPYEKDQSNGGAAAEDGRQLTIQGQKFIKGLGVHADSELRFALNGKYLTFSTWIGIDDEASDATAAIFEVWADGTRLYQSGTFIGIQPARYLTLSVAGKNELKLVVKGALGSPHADWADARLTQGAYLSDLTATTSVNGLGPVELDKTNGGPTAGDGASLILGAVRYAKGLGMYAPADVRYLLNKQYTSFRAMVGPVDGATGGSVIYEVYADDVKKFETPVMRPGDASIPITVDLTLATTLKLVAKDAGDGAAGDAANWGDARILGLAGSSTPTPPPTPTPALPAPTGLTATVGDRFVSLAWNAVTGATSYQIYRGTAAGMSTMQVGTVNTPGFTSAGLTNGTPYFFRVVAANATGTGTFSTEVSATPLAPPPPPPPPPPVTPPGSTTATLQQAWRFLRQSSFGPTQATLDRVRAIGIDAYLEEQFAAAPSTFPDTLLTAPSVEYVEEHFYRNTLVGTDQLRQRVAFALSQIFVVSAVEVDCAEAMVYYLRILQNGAFGNFNDLMRQIVLHPAMGEYLDMVNNAKADTTRGFLPNENLARELMQLFTLGLTELNVDGTPKLNPQGQQVPTYDQTTVMNLTRALTGWTYPDGVAGNPTRLNYTARYDLPMEPVERQHDNGQKTVFGQVFPAGQTASQDFDQAMRVIFNHPNVGPFIARSLIQKLTSSNPSAAYVQAVAEVFNNNGSGVRGDLRAVVKKIFTHPEAQQLGTTLSGKMLEPALFVTSIVRPLGTNVTDHPFMSDLSSEMGQRIYHSPSVFNYFSPGYRIAGTGQIGPEFQIYTTATALTRANFVARLFNGSFGSSVTVDLTPYTTLAATPDALIDKVASLFLGGQIPSQLRTTITTAVQAARSNREKAQTALYLVLSSPYYQVDH
ncbi:MAG: DUF1800 family protein [Bryobacteraceae bacterium]